MSVAKGGRRFVIVDRPAARAGRPPDWRKTSFLGETAAFSQRVDRRESRSSSFVPERCSRSSLLCAEAAQGLPPFPLYPFARRGVASSATLRTAFHLTKPNTFLPQSSCQGRYAPMVFGIIPECRSASFRNQRSASPESPTMVDEQKRDYRQEITDDIIRCWKQLIGSD